MRFKLILFILVIIGLIAFLRSQGLDQRDQKEVQEEVRPFLTPTVTIAPSPKSSGIQSSWFIVRDINKITLHSNLKKKLSALEFQEKNQCESVINGGFFAQESPEDFRHIGLFVENGDELSKASQNSLFNGYFSIRNNTPVISKEVPINPSIALQTGPLLLRTGSPLNLSIKRDEPARRMIAATTTNGSIIFFAFYDSSSLILGPTLEELPELIGNINEENNLMIDDAINLDGGSHSTFLSNEVQLTDIQTPGSYFCIKS